MTPDHVRGRLSSDAGVTSSSIISPTIPSPISTLSTAPFMMLSPASTTSDNLIHRRFPYGLLSSGRFASEPVRVRFGQALVRVASAFSRSGLRLHQQHSFDYPHSSLISHNYLL